MKHLSRSFFLCSFVLVFSGVVFAQDGPSRAEFECMLIANSSSAVAPPGELAPHLSPDAFKLEQIRKACLFRSKSGRAEQAIA